MGFLGVKGVIIVGCDASAHRIQRITTGDKRGAEGVAPYALGGAE